MLELARIARALATNQVARLAPVAYLHMTEQTGRGRPDAESPAQVAGYFHTCVDDYITRLGVQANRSPLAFEDQVVLEYGPGDLPGVGMLLVGLGARKVYCVDRFPMVSVSPKNARVVASLLASTPEPQRARMAECLRDPSRPQRGFREERIEYLVTPHGLSGLRDAVDLVISRAVLEHVDDLDATFDDMLRAMRVGARALHQVDLKSHGLHRNHPLDFLECPPWLWSAMFSHKGVPNRWRVNRYREIVAGLPVRDVVFAPTLHADPRDVAAVRPRLARTFRDVSDEDLSCLGFWLSFARER